MTIVHSSAKFLGSPVCIILVVEQTTTVVARRIEGSHQGMHLIWLKKITFYNQSHRIFPTKWTAKIKIVSFAEYDCIFARAAPIIQGLLSQGADSDRTKFKIEPLAFSTHTQVQIKKNNKAQKAERESPLFIAQSIHLETNIKWPAICKLEDNI